MHGVTRLVRRHLTGMAVATAISLALAAGASPRLADSVETAPVTLVASHTATATWSPQPVSLNSRAGVSNTPAAVAPPTAWQVWGAWKEVKVFQKLPLKAMCRNYSEAVVDGRRLLITSAVTCNHRYYAAIYSAVFGPDMHHTSRVCQDIPANDPCVITYHVDNPGGRQDFGVVTNSNYVGDLIPEAVLHFRT